VSDTYLGPMTRGLLMSGCVQLVLGLASAISAPSRLKFETPRLRGHTPRDRAAPVAPSPRLLRLSGIRWKYSNQYPRGGGTSYVTTGGQWTSLSWCQAPSRFRRSLRRCCLATAAFITSINHAFIRHVRVRICQRFWAFAAVKKWLLEFRVFLLHVFICMYVSLREPP
jgi:hypothetical protein